jgi:ribosomal protein L16 Arg81 hydroxylase
MTDRHDAKPKPQIPEPAGGEAAERIFERFLAPLSAREFFERYWGERYLLLHRDAPSYSRDLFSFADVDRYLALAVRHPSSFVSVIQAGQPVHRTRLADVQPSRLYGAFHAGATILLEAVDLCWPPLAELAATLRRSFSARVKINAYATPPGAQGAHLHPDIQDVFAVQLEGAKEWWIYEERVHEPVEHLTHASFLNDPSVKASYERDEGASARFEKAILKPGDLLYMPRGVVHKAAASQGTPSLHLSIGVTPISWVDVLKAAVEAASTRHPALCRALPPGFEDIDTKALSASLREAFDHAVLRIAEDEVFERALNVLKRSRAADVPYLGDGHFEQLLHAETIEPSTWIERRDHAGLLVAVSGESASIQFGAAEVKGPESLAPALAFIRDHDRFQVSDLPGSLPDKSKVVLIKRLVREGLLRASRGGPPR